MRTQVFGSCPLNAVLEAQDAQSGPPTTVKDVHVLYYIAERCRNWYIEYTFMGQKGKPVKVLGPVDPFLGTYPPPGPTLPSYREGLLVSAPEPLFQGRYVLGLVRTL